MHRIRTWAATDVGRARKGNEDSYLDAPELGLVAVADGMGGYQRGEVASELACRVLREAVQAGAPVIEAFRESPQEARREAVIELLEDAVQQACRQIHDASLSLVGEGGRMGTTLDAVLVVGSTAFLVHVGDGRIYLMRGNELHPLTEDHTLVQQQLNDGVIDEAQARRATNKNVITRALGVFPSALVDSLVFELDPRDLLLLCSDGLHRYLGRKELALVIEQQGAKAACDSFVRMANERGGRDNITVVLVRPVAAETTVGVEDDRVARRMEVLRRVDLFQACTYRQLLEFALRAQEIEVPRGAVLFHDGDRGEDFFVLVEGSVAIEKGETRLAALGPGHYFGELVLIDRPVRSATARVLHDARLMRLDRQNFLQLLRQDAALGASMMFQLARKLAQHLRSTNERLVSETITLEELEAPPG